MCLCDILLVFSSLPKRQSFVFSHVPVLLSDKNIIFVNSMTANYYNCHFFAVTSHLVYGKKNTTLDVKTQYDFCFKRSVNLVNSMSK